MHPNAMHSRPETAYGLIEEVRAGIDWVSCSLVADARGRTGWQNECIHVLSEIADDGHQVTTFGLMGYRGIKVGGSFAGQREDGSYLQLAGHYAQKFFRRIARPDLHISRMDIAVTVKFRTMPSQLGEHAYSAASDADRNVLSGRHRRIWYMSGTDGGYTLYIGSPTSEERGRLYNKEIQSEIPEYARCWRYETVYRNDRAMAVFEELLAVDELYAPTLCGILVGTWYTSRGVLCGWISDGTAAIRPINKEAPTDAAKKLNWLQTQVKPALRWLIEHGYEEAAKDALGIDK